jgi:hypothetical protein
MKYICRDCERCLFYEEINDSPFMNYLCHAKNISESIYNAETLKWVNGSSYTLYQKIADEYDRKCPYFTNQQDIKSLRADARKRLKTISN